MTRQQQGQIRRLCGLDWWSRQQAIADLVGSQGKGYIRHLEEGVRNHDDAAVRNVSMEVYRALGIRAFPSLRELINEDDPEVRLFAVNIFSWIKHSDALPLLFSSIEDPDVNVRIASAEALGQIGNPEALTVLEAALDDDPWVAMAAINAMGEIGGEASLELLYRCLGREGYQEIAINAIEKAGNRNSIQHLAACFENAGMRDAALGAIVRIGEKEGVRLKPEYFANIVPMLAKMIDSRNPETRRDALTALCWSKDIAGLYYLIEAVRDAELQEHALEGLLNIGRKAVCAIVDEMKGSTGSHRPMLAKVLAMMEENKALLQFAADEDPEVRAEVALALGSVDLKRSRTTLDRMLSDPCEEVRHAARKSLSAFDIDKHE
jgi:HEAT repeat protein